MKKTLLFLLPGLLLISSCEQNSTICYKLGEQRQDIIDILTTTNKDIPNNQLLIQALSRTDSTITSVCNCK